MRKIVTWLMMSLDGVIESPEAWQRPYATEEMGEIIAGSMGNTDTLLFGRKTYEKFAGFWPYQSNDVPFAEVMNTRPKLVVSNTLKTVDWQHSTLVHGDAAQELTKIKHLPGKDIVILGSGMLVRSLLHADVLDVLQVLVHPLILGSGDRLFDGETGRKPLQLIESRTLNTGIMALTYVPDPVR